MARGAPAVHQAGGSGALRPRKSLSHAEKRDGSVGFSRWYGPALVSLARHVQLVLHKCTTRYTGVNDTGDQHEDGGGRAS